MEDKHQQFNTINNKIFNWTIDGKISWHNKLNNHAGTCYINWKKLSDKTQIRLQSALNLENLVIESNNLNNQIKILTKNGKIYNYSIDSIAKTGSQEYLPELEQIKEAINTISLNLNHLNYWLLGIPFPSKKYTLTSDGFTQTGWKVAYSNYKKYDPYYNKHNQFILPNKIIISNNKLQITIKVVVLDRLFP